VGASPTRRSLQPEAAGAAKEVTNWLKPSESVSRIGDSASVQAVTRVNVEQALYEAFEVKHYVTAFFTFFIPVSLFDLETRFFVPTHGYWKPARAAAVKVGRRSALASRSIVSRPCLDRPEHGGTLVVVGMTRPRGARCRGTRNSCRNLVSGRSMTT
jgi:hypothetical protein